MTEPSSRHKSNKKEGRKSLGKSVKFQSTSSFGAAPSLVNKSLEGSLISEESKDMVVVTAYYDSYNYLNEILLRSLVIVHRKIIQGLNVCLPFHEKLTKLTISKGGLSSDTLHEIGKLLPHSNITDLCFDDTYVPEGNYYVLLDKTSKLRYLSLRRCNLNDQVCNEIAQMIKYRGTESQNLKILDLSSNNITDVGAAFLGISLRTNRCLFYLNLCDNELTDKGAEAILRHLVEFPLNYEEILEKRRRRLTYLENKAAVFKTFLEDIMHSDTNAENVNPNSLRTGMKTKSENKRSNLSQDKTTLAKVSQNKRQIVKTDDETRYRQAETMTLEFLGGYEDIFDKDHALVRNGISYSIGNLTLCWLNLAYNNLGYISVKNICDVLKYQDILSGKNQSKPDCTGLLNIVVEGNNMPSDCIELKLIHQYLMRAIGRREVGILRSLEISKSKGKLHSEHLSQQSKHRVTIKK